MKTRYIVCGIIQDQDKLILGKKSKGRPPYPDVWHTPGGGVKDGKRAQDYFKKKDFNHWYFHQELQREIMEELGIKIKNIKCIVPQYRSKVREARTLDKHNKMTHYYFLEYLCDYASGKLKPADDIAKAKWVKKTELKNITLTPPSQEMYQELGWIK